MPKFSDLRIYDQKNNLQVCLKFKKKIVVFEANIVSHKNKLYELKVGDLTVKIPDSMVDHVDPTVNESVYKFFLATTNTEPAEQVMNFLVSQSGYSFETDEAIANCPFVIQEVEYDMQYLADELFTFLRRGLKEYGKGDKSKVKPYFPLAYMNIAYLLGKIYGDVGAVAMLNHPATDLFTFIWLSGYATQSALKKCGVEVSSELVPANAKEMEELKEKQEEFMRRLADSLSKIEEESPEEEDDNDPEAE